MAGNWRLPNVKELPSLLDYGRFDPALPLGHPFSGVQPNVYWSSSSTASSPNYAWDVFFNSGLVFQDNKNSSYYVWPVRGGQGG